MVRPSMILVSVLVFVVINLFPWSLRLARHRKTNWRNHNNSIGGNGRGVRSTNTIRAPPDHQHQQQQEDIPKMVVINREASMRTVAQLMDAVNYTARREGKACDVLPSNVTIRRDDPFLIGVSSEVVGQNRSRARRLTSSPNTNNVSSSSARPRYGFVLMVSNHKYMDGAMVVADSLRSYSTLVQSGQCDVVLMVPEKINAAVLELLSYVFDRVLVIRSMDQHSPLSYYKTTFDKMYLYALHEYETVIFFDADSLIVGNPDKLFTKASEKFPLTAVGGTEYFQTALLIVRPSWHTFLDLYLEYRYGSFGYNQWRARDGILFRNCLLLLHDGISHPTGSVYHFYGYIKPWFNKDVSQKQSKERLTFDDRYAEWWQRYERLHKAHFVALALRDRKAMGSSYKYGESALLLKGKNKFLPLGVGSKEDLANVAPSDYMWMMRFSGGSEYLRPTMRHYAELRNEPPLPSTIDIIVADKPGTTCAAVCNEKKRHCVDDALKHSRLNDCRELFRNRLGPATCKTCRFDFGMSPSTSAAPYIKGGMWTAADSAKDAKIKVVATSECVMNFMHEPTTLPLCNASAPLGARRICACELTTKKR